MRAGWPVKAFSAGRWKRKGTSCPPYKKIKVVSLTRMRLNQGHLQGGLGSATVINPRFVNIAYFELYRMKTDRHFLKQKVVSYARTEGIKAACRLFGCSRNTVRKWAIQTASHMPPPNTGGPESSGRPFAQSNASFANTI